MEKVFMLIVAIGLFAISANSQNKLALYGGLNASWLNYGTKEYQTNIPGFVIIEENNSLWKIGGDYGLRTQIKLSDKVLLHTGAGLSNRGFDDVITIGNEVNDLRISLRYVDIPLMLHGYFNEEGQGKTLTSIGMGLQLSFLSGSDVKIRPYGGEWSPINHTEAFRKSDVSLVGSVTIQPQRFYIELMGGLGFLSPIEELSGAIPVFVKLRAGYFIF